MTHLVESFAQFRLPRSRATFCIENLLDAGARSGELFRGLFYFLREAKRSPSVQCWTILVTSPFASLMNSTTLPSMLKLFSDMATKGIFPILPGSIIRRSPSKVTNTGAADPDEAYGPTY